jgi:hypothetical protein
MEHRDRSCLLGHFEVLLRNALHEQLSARSTSSHGDPHWYITLGRL